jgi:uncharacterized membrane protein YgdD (TMEM256/DUF423 family)
MTDRTFVAIAALLGLGAVAAGAFATHAIADPAAARLVETASRYQMWHALAMLGVAALGLRARPALWSFVLGVALFSGSLYGLASGAPRPIAWLTPVGGLALIAGWALLAMAACRRS